MKYNKEAQLAVLEKAVDEIMLNFATQRVEYQLKSLKIVRLLFKDIREIEFLLRKELK